MVKKIIILLTLTLFLVELHQVFPKKVYLHLFPLYASKTESIRWYVTAIVNLVLWIEAFVLWRISLLMTERERWELKSFLALMVIFRGMGLVVYLLNGAVVSPLQLIVYIPMLLYVLSIQFRTKYWQILEWVYAKWQKIRRNGNNRGTP
jgi:hypothetical protein